MRSIRLCLGLITVLALCAMPALSQDSGKKDKPDPKPAKQDDAKKGDAKDAGKKDEAKKDDKKAAAATGAKIGADAPDFTLTGTDGKTYKLSDLKDKVVVLQWANSECPYCNKAAAKMKETSDKYTPKGVVWLAVDSTNTHDSKVAAEYAKTSKWSYPILMDTDGKVGHAYGAKTTPQIFIINKGKLVYNGAHDDKKDRNYMSESLDAILAGKAVPVAETESYGCSVKYASK